MTAMSCLPEARPTATHVGDALHPSPELRVAHLITSLKSSPKCAFATAKVSPFYLLPQATGTLREMSTTFGFRILPEEGKRKSGVSYYYLLHLLLPPLLK